MLPHSIFVALVWVVGSSHLSARYLKNHWFPGYSAGIAQRPGRLALIADGCHSSWEATGGERMDEDASLGDV